MVLYYIKNIARRTLIVILFAVLILMVPFLSGLMVFDHFKMATPITNAELLLCWASGLLAIVILAIICIILEWIITGKSSIFTWR